MSLIYAKVDSQAYNISYNSNDWFSDLRISPLAVLHLLFKIKFRTYKNTKYIKCIQYNGGTISQLVFYFIFYLKFKRTGFVFFWVYVQFFFSLNIKVFFNFFWHTIKLEFLVHLILAKKILILLKTILFF